MSIQSLVTRYGGEVVRYLAVGIGGLILNQSVFALMHFVLGVPLLLASALGVEAAALNNYWWHEQWTFRRRTPNLKDLLRFNTVSLIGIAVTVSSLAVLVRVTPLPPFWANLVAIGIGVMANYLLSRTWVWRVVKDA